MTACRHCAGDDQPGSVREHRCGRSYPTLTPYIFIGTPAVSVGQPDGGSRFAAQCRSSSRSREHAPAYRTVKDAFVTRRTTNSSVSSVRRSTAHCPR